MRFLINRERKELIVQPCNQHEPLAFKVPKDLGPKSHGLDINSITLLTVVYSTFGWDKKLRYLAYGRYLEKENIVVFDLANCEPISEISD